MRLILVLIAAAGLAGCATTGDAQPEARQLAVTTSDYCGIARPLRWSPDDTPDSITAMKRENAKFNRTCGKRKS